jgi:hypothetical protein
MGTHHTYHRNNEIKIVRFYFKKPKTHSTFQKPKCFSHLFLPLSFHNLLPATGDGLSEGIGYLVSPLGTLHCAVYVFECCLFYLDLDPFFFFSSLVKLPGVFPLFI